MKAENTKRIDRYLRGEMDEKDQLDFEQELLTNKTLQQEFELQKDIEETIKRNHLRTVVKQIAKRYHFNRKLYYTGIILVVSALLTLAGLFTWKMLNRTTPLNESELISLYNELEKTPLIEHLEGEFFIWENTDTLVLSKSGVLLSMPKSSFLLNGEAYSGRAVIQWQEALDGPTMVKNGLSTVADTNLLETQGMFSFRAYSTEGELLDINPATGVYVQVPVEEHKVGMQLYDGVKNEEGIINWVNPEPLMKIPVPVNMDQLDFYPEGYEDTLNNMKLRKDRTYRDSLYLAMESGYTSNVDLGKDLFESKCQSCHRIGENSTGPDLRFVRNKWMRAGETKEMLYQFVRDWSKTIDQSAYARTKIYWSPTAMTKFPELTNCEIESVLEYVDDRGNVDVAKEKKNCGHFDFIFPSKVLSFWNTKFNTTLLATREFERRMQSIHETCDNRVLDVYVKNLHLPLTELDKRAKEMGYPEFAQFEAEYVGAVNPNNPHLQGLRKFYEQNTNKLRKHAQSLKRKELERRDKWDQEMAEARITEKDRTNAREAQAFSEEYDLNYKHVVKQLGGGTVGFVIYGNSPVKNIDRQVYEATLARKTTTIVDPITGKTAQITYNSFTFEVEDHRSYDRLYAYLFPSKINSYQRITATNGKFDYALNDYMLYDVAVIGINKKGYFYYQKTKLNNGHLGTVLLDKVSEEKLDASIRQLNKMRMKTPMPIKDELKWLFKEQANYIEQEKRLQQTLFERKIKEILFPCFSPLTDSIPSAIQEEYGDMIRFNF